MQRYVLKMFADGWREWTPAMAVVGVISTMIGLCVHQYAWTMTPQFRDAVAAAGAPLAEYQILSITIYVVIALVSWVALTVVGKASVHASRHTHALWLLLGASPRAVFLSTLYILLIVSFCGAMMGAIASTFLGFWVLPAFDGAVSPAVDMPRFTVALWAPLVVVIIGVATAIVGGVVPAYRASRIQPGVALRTVQQPDHKSTSSVLRIVSGSFFLLIAVALVAASKLDQQLASAGLAPIINLAFNAGASALIGVYLMCPEIVGFLFRVLHKVFDVTDLVVSALGTRAAAARSRMNVTTIAPLAAGLGGVGLLLCALGSVGAVVQILEPGVETNMTDTWIIIAVVIVSMFATSAAVVALSARGRGHEVALLQSAGMSPRQVIALIGAESFAMSLAATLVAAVPVVVGGVVCAFATATALNGPPVVEWPFKMMSLGMLGAWLLLFLILAIPTIGPLRNGPSAQLRGGGV
ncbi:ABC transporter permease [Corynebacterium sp. CCUG 65737]|uniref:FtsX-like permease family protein n=1 Tax=Corynebacterium sp. CCUG 65737 TaxID=2823889 RepID=UPI00210BE4E5|nr:ABC transporter permease [Corynebacterium sp. CCUG 65737]MCQ4617647.1 ABC transporter permease [Corynebacterium pseudogenitalium]MCQ4626421.1 ABC transporter permease [Corynebacterium sp. CCUG 65737]